MGIAETTKPYDFKPENLHVAMHGGRCFVAAANSQAFLLRSMLCLNGKDSEEYVSVGVVEG